MEGYRLRKRYERTLHGEHPLRAAGWLWPRQTEESVLIMVADVAHPKSVHFALVAHGPPSHPLTIDPPTGHTTSMT